MFIRPGTPDDFPALVELWKEFMDFHADNSGYFRRAPDGHENWQRFLTARLGDEDFLLLMAFVDDRAVGYCVATVLDMPPVFVERKYGFIQDMAVTAAYRRRGIAGALFDRARRWLEGRGMTRLELKVDAGNQTSQGFWRAMGFRPHTETWWRPVKE